MKLNETEGFWSPSRLLWKCPCMDLLGLTSSRLQHWNSSSKDIRDIQGGSEVSGIRERAGGVAFSQTEVLAEAKVLCWTLPTKRASRWCYIWVSISLAHTICPTLVIHWHSAPHNLQAHPNRSQWLFHTNGTLGSYLVFPKISLTSTIWLQPSPYLSLSSPRPGTSGSRPSFAAWPFLSTSKPSTSSSHLQITVHIYQQLL